MGYEEFLLGMDGMGRVFADVGARTGTDWSSEREGVMVSCKGEHSVVYI